MWQSYIESAKYCQFWTNNEQNCNINERSEQNSNIKERSEQNSDIKERSEQNCSKFPSIESLIFLLNEQEPPPWTHSPRTRGWSPVRCSAGCSGPASCPPGRWTQWPPDRPQRNWGPPARTQQATSPRSGGKEKKENTVNVLITVEDKTRSWLYCQTVKRFDFFYIIYII